MLMSFWWQMSVIMTRHWSVTRVSGFRNAEWSHCSYLRPHNPLLTALPLAYLNIALAHRLLSKRENTCSLTEKWPFTMHTQGLQVSFSCNFRIIYLIKPVWSWFACLFSLTLTAGKNSNKASSSSNVDSVVGCSHISNFSQTSKRNKVFPNYIVCYEHQNWFSISCGEVPRWSQSS